MQIRVNVTAVSTVLTSQTAYPFSAPRPIKRIPTATKPPNMSQKYLDLTLSADPKLNRKAMFILPLMDEIYCIAHLWKFSQMIGSPTWEKRFVNMRISRVWIQLYSFHHSHELTLILPTLFLLMNKKNTTIVIWFTCLVLIISIDFNLYFNQKFYVFDTIMNYMFLRL